MRTGLLLLEAPICFAELSATESCPVFAFWPSTWMPRPPHLQEPDASWSAFWFVSASFEASAEDETLFDCSSEPSLPELPMRIGPAELPESLPQPHFSFSRPGSCSADDSANAPCSVSDFWPSA